MQHYLNVANNDGSFNENVPDSDNTPESSPGPSQDISDIMALLPSYHTSILDDAIGAFTPGEDLDMLSISGLSPIPALTDVGYEILVAKADSLVKGLRDLHFELEASDSMLPRPHDIGELENIFCAEKIRFFTAAFFRLTHVHFPLVHYPTFGVPETSTYLILAVTIFGASRCAPFKHTVQAKAFTALAEEYIFREVHRLNTEAPFELALEQLQTMQAAVAITNLMINHNDWSLRERGRLKRLPVLIYSVRLFKLTDKNSPLTLDWHQFIFNETAAGIATMTAVVDWNHARMFYCPPHLAIAEMKCSLPCHRELWDAPNATAYIVAKEAIDAASLASKFSFATSIATFISSLMANDWPLHGSFCHLNLTLESLSATSYGKLAKLPTHGMPDARFARGIFFHHPRDQKMEGALGLHYARHGPSNIA
ncbi:hypothetical protein NLG97_g2122 [Lecanicillium saksenae]|uniref:Uncharacterized protein n=1 Tax=Lecanicillium saksenae TaxID=468837 RepID=A0ACC1R3P1_9HYPO|nr:hypothetical protein NLG97_g2122 [Lecanicillium saksenae]